MKHEVQPKTNPENFILAGYVGPDELCRQLGKTSRTLARWHERGIGPPRVRVGRLILYKVEDLRAWLEGHKERREQKGHRKDVRK